MTTLEGLESIKITTTIETIELKFIKQILTTMNTVKITHGDGAGHRIVTVFNKKHLVDMEYRYNG